MSQSYEEPQNYPDPEVDLSVLEEPSTAPADKIPEFPVSHQQSPITEPMVQAVARAVQDYYNKLLPTRLEKNHGARMMDFFKEIALTQAHNFNLLVSEEYEAARARVEELNRFMLEFDPAFERNRIEGKLQELQIRTKTEIQSRVEGYRARVGKVRRLKALLMFKLAPLEESLERHVIQMSGSSMKAYARGPIKERIPDLTEPTRLSIDRYEWPISISLVLLATIAALQLWLGFHAALTLPSSGIFTALAVGFALAVLMPISLVVWAIFYKRVTLHRTAEESCKSLNEAGKKKEGFKPFTPFPLDEWEELAYRVSKTSGVLLMPGTAVWEIYWAKDVSLIALILSLLTLFLSLACFTLTLAWVPGYHPTDLKNYHELKAQVDVEANKLGLLGEPTTSGLGKSEIKAEYSSGRQAIYEEASDRLESFRGHRRAYLEQVERNPRLEERAENTLISMCRQLHSMWNHMNQLYKANFGEEEERELVEVLNTGMSRIPVDQNFIEQLRNYDMDQRLEMPAVDGDWFDRTWDQKLSEENLEPDPKSRQQKLTLVVPSEQNAPAAEANTERSKIGGAA